MSYQAFKRLLSLFSHSWFPVLWKTLLGLAMFLNSSVPSLVVQDLLLGLFGCSHNQCFYNQTERANERTA